MKKQKEPSLFAYIFANNVFYLIISPKKTKRHFTNQPYVKHCQNEYII